MKTVKSNKIKKDAACISCILCSIAMMTSLALSSTAYADDIDTETINNVQAGGTVSNDDSMLSYYMIGEDEWGQKIGKITRQQASRIKAASSDINGNDSYLERKGIDVGPKWIFKDNPLTQVEDATQNPFRKIAHIDTNMGSCTAEWIGPKTLLTAAHCLMYAKQDNNGYYERTMKVLNSITPMKNCKHDGTDNDYCSPIPTIGLYDSDSYYAWFVNADYWNYPDNLNYNDDWGIIQFSDDSLTKQTGYFGFGSYSDITLTTLSNKIRITGYSGGKSDIDENDSYYADSMTTSTGKITAIEDVPTNNINLGTQRIVEYDASELPGASGAGVELTGLLHKGQLAVINTGQFCSDQKDPYAPCTGTKYNTGTYISPKMFYYLSDLVDDKIVYIE